MPPCVFVTPAVADDDLGDLERQVITEFRRLRLALNLLGEMVTTFRLEANRKLLEETPIGLELLRVADGWGVRFDRIEATKDGGK